MARRMFSPDIVKSDAFLDMSLSTQALYFHLGMEADDDGFVNPKRIMRSIGAGDDEIKLLIGKRFVLPFENGVVVVKHWRVNNLVRKDWYRPTQYTEQKKTLYLKPNGSYTFDPEQGKPLVNDLLTNSLTQVRIGQDRIEKPGADFAAQGYEIKPYEKETDKEPKVKADKSVLKVFELFGSYPFNWRANRAELAAAKNLLAETTLEEMTKMLAYAKKKSSDPFCPTILKPTDLDRKWDNLLAFKKKHG